LHGPPFKEEAYLEFRQWFNAQPEGIQDGDVLESYRAHLATRGLDAGEIDRRIAWLREGGRRQEVEMWNRVLTAENPRFNTDPNAFLVRMIERRPTGRALDVGMGQGRNAIWLARQGWDVTGFDPADRAVALARELAAEAGVTIATETVGSEEFDWGSERWDLVVLSYVTVREWVDTIHRALRPGGLVVLEAFHEDATENRSIAPADFGRAEMRVVRLLAMRE
jgi:2-polyprenyl-3-methyl-5-hydroxy-6-metoxy-1,4-benzoquinol methylase